jgi:hypothetical protein
MNKKAMPNKYSLPQLTKKRQKLQTILADDVKENLQINGIRNCCKRARDQRKWRKTEFEAKVHNGL